MTSVESKKCDFSRPRDVDVTFAIACYNAMPYLDAAVRSALGQRRVTCEVVLVDDGSTDGSLLCASEWARRDSRVQALQTPQNLGPGGARNVALSVMRGRWLAVLDSDDLITPDRTRRLLDAAEDNQADLVADDLQIFGEGVEEARFLADDWSQGARWMTRERYLDDAVLFGRRPNPGFLKPMFRRSFLERHKLSYNPELRIAEDDELALRCLLAGARYLIVPEPMYHYRKHAASISHRLSLANLDRIMCAEMNLRQQFEAQGALSSAYRRRWRSFANARAFTVAVDRLKQRRFLAAAYAILRRPQALPLFAMPLAARLRRGRST